MTDRADSRSIDDAAAGWVALADRAPLSPEQDEALQAWLNRDPRHAGAYLRARAVALRSESARALGTGYDPADFGGVRVPPPPSRRGVLMWGGGMAASLAGVAAVGIVLQAPEAHATDRGEVRLVPLADGSTVMLNTASRITVKYETNQRRIRLVEGEADFTVVDDAAKPFVVEAGDRRVVASGGGGFRVRKLDDRPVDILVYQGRVRVLPRGGADRAVTLDANTALSVPDAGAGETIRPRPVPPSLVRRELAWRDGKIAFEGETLSEAAAAFARYSDTRLIIVDPALASEPVTGLFAASDPVGFGRAVADMFGASVTERSGAVIIGDTPPRT